MIIQPNGFFYLLLFFSCNVVFAQGIIINEEEYADTDVTDEAFVTENDVAGEALIIEFEGSHEALPAETLNKPVPSRRSINMIVGGQSKDGLAKQSNLPVDD